MSIKNKIEQDLDQKEFENSIEEKLKDEELKREKKEKLDKEYHPVVLMAINLVGNLCIGYFIFYKTISFLWQSFQFFPDIIITVYFLIFHLIIWAITIVGVITKKSPWNRFLR
jgi:hypothetical protein